MKIWRLFVQNHEISLFVALLETAFRLKVVMSLKYLDPWKYFHVLILSVFYEMFNPLINVTCWDINIYSQIQISCSMIRTVRDRQGLVCGSQPVIQTSNVDVHTTWWSDTAAAVSDIFYFKSIISNNWSWW